MGLVLQLLTFNRTETLPMLFDSLVVQTDRDWTLFILDNSTDRMKAWDIAQSIEKEKVRLPIVFFRSDQNIGFDGGHEQLYHKHDASYVMCVNDDAFLEPDFIERLRRVLDTDPKAGAVGGKILRWYFSEDGTVVKTHVIDSLGLARTPWHHVYDIGSGQISSGIEQDLRSVFGVSGCLPMYRRTAIGSHLFDPADFMYKEDVDVAYRLAQRGYGSWTDPRAVAYHRRTLSWQARQSAPVPFFHPWLSYRNHWRNLKRHLGWKDWVVNGGLIVPYEIAKFIYLCYKYRGQFLSAVFREWL